jgi:spore coat protein U-like protein
MRQWTEMKAWRLALVLLTCGVFAGTGQRTHAGAATRCGFVSTSGVRFGSYNAFSDQPLNSAGTIAYQCTGVSPADIVTIELSRGNSGSYQPRAMSGPSPRFEYNLYMDAACTMVWGDGSGGSSVYMDHPPDGRTVSLPIFGRIPPRQLLQAGIYNDLIVVTLQY